MNRASGSESATPQSVQKEEWEKIGERENTEQWRIKGEVAFIEIPKSLSDRISASVREETIEKCAVIAWRTGMDLYMKEIDVREVGAKAAHNIRNLSALQKLSD